MPSLIGNKPNQVPTNGDLGDLAFQNSNAVKSLTVETETVTNQTVTNSTVTTQTVRNPQIDTEITDVRPSLLLDFAKSKVLDPRITFTRASTATFYDGKTVAKAEENLLVRSDEFDNASWTKNDSTVTANATTAPDGTSTADEVFETATTASHAVSQAFPANVSTTISCFFKANGRTFALFGNTNHAVSINLSTGVATSANGSPTNISSVSFGNGWYRVSFNATFTTDPVCRIYLSTDGVWANRSYAGSTSQSIYVWGAQVEQRSAVTAYTATTTAPITNYIPALQTAPAGVARFEHNPITGESLGLEIEEQRANLVVRSDDFDNASWTKIGSSIISNTITAPDGALTGDRIVEDTSTGEHRVGSANISWVGNTQYTVTVYAKAGERTNLDILLGTAGNWVNGDPARSAQFNLSTGTIPFPPTSPGTASITSVGNGWYRCSLTATTVASPSASGVFLRMALPGNTSYTGNGYAGLFVWGAQAEAGAFPTSYIPTVASSVTRSADAASMTGTNFSSWFNNQQGTLHASASAVLSGNRRIAFISDGTTNNRIGLLFNSSSRGQFLVSSSGTLQANPEIVGTTVTSPSFICGTYRVNDFAVTINGSTVGTDTSGALPITANILDIGNQNNTDYLNGTIRKIAYYPLRLPNAELQEMTL